MTDRGSSSVVAPLGLWLVLLATTVVAWSSSPHPTVAQEAENRWLTERRILDMAHGGGLREAPQGTMHAYRTAAERGADVLEMDLHITLDGHVVAIHDSTVDRTTDGTGCVVAKTLAEIKELDAAHTFVPGVGPASGRPESDYPLRGVATGAVPPPAGFTAEDFTIVTLEELFQELPDALMLMELKPTEVYQSHDCPGFVASLPPDERPDLAAEVARLIDAYDMTDRVMVASFIDEMMAEFQAHAPDVDTSFPLVEAVGLYAAYLNGEPPPNPNGHEAVQLPTSFGGIVITEDIVRYARAHGIAVHFWTINSPADMTRLLDWGADGLITDEPTVLDALLETRGDPRPRAASTTTLTTTGEPQVPHGTPIELTASVVASWPEPAVTGTVELRSDGTVLDTVPIDAAGEVTFTVDDLTPGVHDLVAAYSGSDRLTPSTSAAVGVEVARLDVSMSVEAGPAVAGEPVTAVARVEPAAAPRDDEAQPASARADGPTGEVVVSDDDGDEIARATLTGGETAVDLGAFDAGEHRLVAAYLGDARHREASVELTLAVEGTPTTTPTEPDPADETDDATGTDGRRTTTAGSGGERGGRSGDGALARTGFAPSAPLAVGVGLVVAGAAALVAGRRREHPGSGTNRSRTFGA